MEDAAAIAQSLGDFQVSRMLARVPAPYDRQDAVDWLSQTTSRLTPDWTLAITEGDDAHIGVVAFELRHGLWHLGYWLNRYYWGKGLMGEAVSAAADRFFRRMPDVTIHSGAFADNAASLRIQEKLGFATRCCSDLYALSRNARVAHIETELTQELFRPLP